VTRRMAGAVALTVAAVLLMSAAWFYFLSPTTKGSEMIGHYDFALERLASKNVTFSAEEGQTIRTSTYLRHRVLEEPPPPWHPPYNVRIFDPDGKLVLHQENLSAWNNQEFKAQKSGDYVIEIESLSNETTTAEFTIRRIVQFRPAAPIGHWFLMMSLPVLVFGILAMVIKQRE